MTQENILDNDGGLLVEELMSLNNLRESQLKSDFEKLVFSYLPHDSEHNLVRTKVFTPKSKALIKDINDLKEAIKNNVNAGPNVEWDDKKKLESKLERTPFDFDMYIRFTETKENNYTVRELLGVGGENVQPIAGGENENQFCGTKITHETWLWVEISTRLSHARYKVYQLFRAHMALRPDNAKTIMAVIFLNAEKDDAIAVAAQLRDNDMIQRRARESNMHVAIAWTNHRNIISAMNTVEDKLEKVDKGLKDLRDDIHKLSTAVNGLLDLQRPRQPLHIFKGLLNRYRASRENHREDL